MTRQRSFKLLVRARMGKTGESYTAARAALLGVPDAATLREPPPLATSDAEIRRRTGRGWEEWFDVLDGWGAEQMTHRALARRVADELHIVPLKWEAQAVTVSYERARAGRAVGQGPDGYTITASRTVTVPVEELFDALADPSRRASWLPEAPLTQRAATAPRSVRFDWADGLSRVNAVLESRSATKATVTIEHTRLVDAGDADRMRRYWRQHLLGLKTQLEAGATDV